MCSVGTHSDCSDPQVQGRLKETKVMGGRAGGGEWGREGEGEAVGDVMGSGKGGR